MNFYQNVIKFLLLSLLMFATLARAEGFLTRLLHHPVPGGVAVVALDEYQNEPQVFYQKHRVLVVKENNKRFIAIVGIPLTAKGTQTLMVNKQAVLFDLDDKKYPAEYITLKNTKYVTPDPDHVKRINKERDAQLAAYKFFSTKNISNLYFDVPVEGRKSAVFGVQRFFNGQKRNSHSGLDIAAPVGTPVKMPADGVVLLTGHFFFNGKTVIVDHGRSLMSMFCHLSKIDVKKGQKLKRGDVVGKVGTTGRVTGAHLHWSVSLNNVRVDPAIFIGKYANKRADKDNDADNKKAKTIEKTKIPK